MPRQLIIALAFIATACSSRLTTSEKLPQSRQLAGLYVSTGQESLIDTLEFTDWNVVQLAKGYIPPTTYYIEGDTLIVETDKAYLLYQIINDDLLLGNSFWVEEDTLRKVDNTPAPPPHISTGEDINWLALNKRFYDIYNRPSNFLRMDEVLEELEDNFQKGHYRSGELYAQISLIKGDTFAALEYSGAACRAGYYRACFQKGEFEMDYGQRDSAYYYFQKGCEMGHTGSCYMLELVDWTDE